MPIHDFSAPRMFVEPGLAAEASFDLTKPQANYLLNVLRMREADAVLVFNGRDGEWRAHLSVRRRGDAALTCIEQTRPQPPAPDLLYGFALLKHGRLDYLVQKAVEMGVGVLQPFLTRRTQISRVNGERMRANVIEAAEQCGVLHVPEVREERRLEAVVGAWEPERLLVFCDEDAEIADPVEALRVHRTSSGAARPVGVVIGPEGGFDPVERASLLALPHVVRLSLGPRILRADTAAVAALAVVQTALGDWRAEEP